MLFEPMANPQSEQEKMIVRIVPEAIITIDKMLRCDCILYSGFGSMI